MQLLIMCSPNTCAAGIQSLGRVAPEVNALLRPVEDPLEEGLEVALLDVRVEVGRVEVAEVGGPLGRAVAAAPVGSTSSATMCACGTLRRRAKIRHISYFVKGSGEEKCRMEGRGFETAK